jgi:hypothetical protein
LDSYLELRRCSVSLFALSFASLLVGCSAHADPAAEAPPRANIVPGADPSLFAVDHPEPPDVARNVGCDRADGDRRHFCADRFRDSLSPLEISRNFLKSVE